MKKLILPFLVLFCSISLHAQVGIGIETPHASSILDVTSTSKGLLMPRMTTVQRDAIASPATGLFVFNTTTNNLNMFNGVIWYEFTTTATQGLVATIDTAGATTSGTLTAGSAASSVSTSFNYTGGNGKPYPTQSYSSTGVTGLTATLTAGTMANGNGSLSYTITGTPSGSGTATFTITVGGQTSTFSVTVYAVGSIASLTNCGSPTNNGTLTSGVAASSVSSVISYSGGNGGTHSGQTVTSTGVTGLTATLSSGIFTSSTGNLTYNITGTPSASGTASFAINIGGRTCSITREVALPVGTLASINCPGTPSGTLTSGTAASSVSSVISYTGGNGGTHNGQTVTSTGVTGLTATLTAGTFASGAGNLTYNITGTPSAAGTAAFAINIGGQTCSLTRTVVAGTVACLVGTTTVVDVTTSTGKTWMDRNLGAHQAATSSTDAQAYGDLYQWGRGNDGHQCRTSATTSSPSSIDTPSNGNFILGNPSWRSTTTSLWQGTSGVNNPCPSGYRIATPTEFQNEANTWGAQQNPAGAFGSPLKFTIGGLRDGAGAGGLFSVNTTGYYWTNTISFANNTYAISMNINSSSINTSGTQTNQTNGMSVRCIKGN